MSEKQQRLVLAVIDFLNQSIQDGTVKQDDREGLEVAVQCIGEAFGVDPTDSQQASRLSIKPANLQTIFDVFLKTRDKVGAQSTAPGPASTPSPATPAASSPGNKAEAEKLKQAGNSQMSSKQYDSAIDSYTKAIALDPTNPVYYSNRAAAYSSKQDHESAIDDAEKAVEVDPTFSKAFHRLGHAHYSLGNFPASAAAFRRGLEIDPSNANLKAGLQNAESRIVPSPTSSPPPFEQSEPGITATTGAGANAGMGGMADMLRGMGGAGGAGGMPDLASLMNNPMMMQMAQQMMANGGLERMMQNPALANLRDRAQSGGGMPSMADIMADPSLRDLANQFMGGTGGGAGA